MAADSANPIILYDGVCGLCNRLVRFVLKRDSRALFRFASLQSEFAATVLVRHGAAPDQLDTMYLVLGHGTPSEHLLDRADAGLFVWRNLGAPWKWIAAIYGLLPRPLRNWGYLLVARNRYRFFGKYDTCPLPDPRYRSRFLDEAR